MNTIQKILFIALIPAGIIVWSYNGLLLMEALPQTGYIPPDRRPDPVEQRPALTLRSDTTRARYTGNFRDPFEPVPGRSDSNVRYAKTPSASRRPETQTPPPSLTLLGIVWSATSPMAAVLGPDGRTENLRVGMTIAGATVTRIEPSAVTMRSGARTFRLTPPGPQL